MTTAEDLVIPFRSQSGDQALHIQIDLYTQNVGVVM
jgi:hypothetical protein